MNGLGHRAVTGSAVIVGTELIAPGMTVTDFIYIGTSVATCAGFFSPDIDVWFDPNMRGHKGWQLGRLLPIRHRTITHWPSMSLLVWTVLLIVLLNVAPPNLALLITFGVATGHTAHLIEDGWTVSGIPIYGPISRKDRWLLPKPLRFRGDGPVGAFLTAAAPVATMFFLMNTYGGM